MFFYMGGLPLISSLSKNGTICFNIFFWSFSIYFNEIFEKTYEHLRKIRRRVWNLNGHCCTTFTQIAAVTSIRVIEWMSLEFYIWRTVNIYFQPIINRTIDNRYRYISELWNFETGLQEKIRLVKNLCKNCPFGINARIHPYELIRRLLNYTKHVLQLR